MLERAPPALRSPQCLSTGDPITRTAHQAGLLVRGFCTVRYVGSAPLGRTSGRHQQLTALQRAACNHRMARNCAPCGSAAAAATGGPASWADTALPAPGEPAWLLSG